MAVFSAGLLLAGCDDKDIAAGCPVLKRYSQDTLDRVSVELAKLSSDSATKQLLKDYGALRAACRTK